MDLDDLHPTDDYSHRFFIWHEWIQANGPLTAENAFEYFATSMFYDKQSNNQVLRMQTMLTGQPLQNEAEQLKRFTGIEFALVHAEPPTLFIIHKRERLSPDEVRPLAAYFIMRGRIYQSPDIYNILSNRLLTSLQSLQTSLDILRSHRPDFTPRSGFVWPIVDTSADELAAKKRSAEEGLDGQTITDPSQSQSQGANVSASDSRRAGSVAPSVASESKKQQNLLPLFNALRTTAIHSTKTFNERAAESVPPPENADTRAGSVAGRMSSTPAPAAATPKIAPTPIPPEAPKPAAAPVKRKKKRMSNAPPVTASLQ